MLFYFIKLCKYTKKNVQKNYNFYLKNVRVFVRLNSLNITNTVIKTIALSAITSVNSTFGDNYRYLRFKYNIGTHIWISSLNEVTKCISLYISIHEHVLYSSHGVIICDSCLAKDDDHHPEHYGKPSGS